MRWKLLVLASVAAAVLGIGLWSLFAIALIVFGVLISNVLLTRHARRRKANLESFVSRLRLA